MRRNVKIAHPCFCFVIVICRREKETLCNCLLLFLRWVYRGSFLWRRNCRVAESRRTREQKESFIKELVTLGGPFSVVKECVRSLYNNVIRRQMMTIHDPSRPLFCPLRESHCAKSVMHGTIPLPNLDEDRHGGCWEMRVTVIKTHHKVNHFGKVVLLYQISSSGVQMWAQ